MQDIGNKVAKGAIWMVMFKLAERSLGLISTIILARLLIPEDFGLVAMAMSIIAALELLGAFSFDIALIQKQDASRKHYDTAWTFNVLFGIVCALVLWALADPAAMFYDDPRLEEIILLLAVGCFVQRLENIGVVAFRKELDFRKEFIFLFAKKVMSFTVTVTLALIYQNYWALVFGMLTGRLASVVLSYWIHPYRPRLSLAAAGELFGFSKWLLINNVLYFLNNRSSDFIIGKIEGARTLGLFNISYEISNLATTELVAPVNRAVYPGFAKISHDQARLRRAFMNAVSLMLVFSLPAAVGIAALAELLVPVMLGDKWLEAIPLIQILAYCGAVSVVESSIYYVFLAVGRPQVSTYLSLGQVVLLISLVITLTLEFGVHGAVWAFLAVALVMLPVKYYFVCRQLDLKFRVLLKELWRPVVASLLMLAAINLFLAYAGEAEGLLWQVLHLFGAILIGAVCYISAILLLWLASSKPQGAEHYILEKIKGRLKLAGSKT